MRWIRITVWNWDLQCLKKVEQINDHLFIDAYYKSNNITIGVNDMTVNDSEMFVSWKDEA